MFTSTTSSVSVEIEKVENGYVVTWRDDTVNDDSYNNMSWPAPKRKATSGTRIFPDLKEAMTFVKEHMT